VRDVATRGELFFIPADRPISIPPVDLSPDGRYLAVGTDRYRAVRFIDRSGDEVGTTIREDGGFSIDRFRFAPDSRLIAIEAHRGADRRVRIWDWQRGVVVTEIAVGFEDPREQGDTIYGSTLAFGRGGRRIAATRSTPSTVRPGRSIRADA